MLLTIDSPEAKRAEREIRAWNAVQDHPISRTNSGDRQDFYRWLRWQVKTCPWMRPEVKHFIRAVQAYHEGRDGNPFWSLIHDPLIAFYFD